MPPLKTSNNRSMGCVDLKLAFDARQEQHEEERRLQVR